jgi:RimJ/RimL family protein N-acetyltransferase
MPTFAPRWPIETERLRLRPFEPSDLDTFAAMQADPETVRWLYNDPRERAASEELLGRKAAGAAVAAEGDWLSAAVVLRATGEHVGEASLHWVSELHRQGEVGYLFARAHEGNGYATEAARELLRFGFETMDLHRIVGRLESRNVASARVLEKLGMRREAELVENEWVKGEWQSETVYALLDREWRSGRGGAAVPTG